MTCIGANLASHKFGFLPHIRLTSLKIKPPSLSGEIREHESRTSLRLFVTLQEVRQPEDCRARGGYSLFHTSFGPCTNSARVRQRAELRHSGTAVGYGSARVCTTKWTGTFVQSRSGGREGHRRHQDHLAPAGGTEHATSQHRDQFLDNPQ